METVGRKQFAKMLAERVWEHRFPLQGMFELTPVCNLDCKMCYVHLPEDQAKQRMLTGDQWIALMDEAISAGMLYALLTGGEALTHPDFWRIYDHLKHKGIRIQLKSNGVLLRGETLERLAAMPPDPLDISLYGCNAESYRAVTGQDVFDRVTENIRAARDAGLHVRLMVTPSRAMMPWVEETLRFAKGFGLPVYVNGALTQARKETGRDIEDYGLTIEENWGVLLKSREILGTDPVIMDDEPVGKATQTRSRSPKGLSCSAGRSMFTIRWQGKMVPCLSIADGLMEADTGVLGFDGAWQRIGEEVESYEIPKDCLMCDLKKICHYCPAVHGEKAIQHLCDPNYCKYAHLREEFKGGAQHE